MLPNICIQTVLSELELNVLCPYVIRSGESLMSSHL